MESFNDVLQNVKKYCMADPGVSEIGYRQWISKLELMKFENNIAYLLTENSMAQGLIIENYSEVLKRGFFDSLGFDVDIKVLVKAREEEAVAAEESEKRISNIVNNTSYDLTFDNFIKGKSNELAYAFCTAVADKYNKSKEVDPNSTFNPLFIYGDSGLGKTHLMKAIEHEVRKNNPDMNIIYTTGESFTNEIIKAIQSNSTIEFHEKYRNSDFLLVDDVQFIAGKDSTQEEFFHTFNELYNAGKQIVLTSDISPSKMSRLENRIKSRFVLGIQVDIQAPDFETRMAIVKRKAELLDLQLTDSVARIIAEKIRTNIRQLEGTVNKIKALTTFTNETPSISMAQRVVKEIMIENHPTEITVDRIINDVATAFKVTPDDIRSQNRRANISLARKMSIYVLREVKGMTYIEIGDVLNKNHSTMTIHYNDATDMLTNNSDLKETVDEIIKNLKEN